MHDMSKMTKGFMTKVIKLRKKFTKKLIAFTRRIPMIAFRLSNARHTRALQSPVKWLAKTRINLKHIELPSFPEETTLLCETTFPTYAWQLHLAKGVNSIRHGSGVETNTGSVFEGVWNGAFEKFDFDKADYVYGSGIKHGEKLTITPPTHMFEGVFILYCKDKQELFAANSLACCIAALPQEDQALWLVELAENMTAINNKQTELGFYKYNTKVAQIAQWELHCLFAHNFVLAPSVPIDVTLRTNVANFDNFAGYEAFVTSVLRQVVENGGSPHRKNGPLSAVSCISTGYDSTAVTAIAKTIGVDDALTLDIDVKGVNDCGDEVAKQLGVSCRSFIHPAGKSIDHLHMLYTEDLRGIASEFVGTPGFGDDILYAAFEDVLSDTILLDGGAGDSVWAIDSTHTEGMPISAPYSKSINEFRLRVGFAYIPAPSIGADFPEAIARISRSDEMKPFSIGGKYDRSIPRRLAEAAGAKRESFGQKKKAANPHPINLDTLKYDALREMVSRYALKTPRA